MARLGVGRAVESFLEMMSAERGAATNTIESYRRDLTPVRRLRPGPGDARPRTRTQG